MKGLIIHKKGIKALAAALVLLFALGQACVYATEPAASSSAQTKIISSVRHIETVYNSFGVAVSSNTHAETVTQTTATKDGKTSTQTTRTVSDTVSTWKGGSIKADSSHTVSDTNGTDGSSSHTVSDVTYTYSGDGKLDGASGVSTTTGENAKATDGSSGGTYKTTSKTSYIIKNAEALADQTVSDTTTTVGGQVKATSHEVTKYTYQLLGGQNHLMSEVSNRNTTYTSGGGEQMTTTKTYSRDANGLCTGLSQTATGTLTEVNETGGTTTYALSNYKVEVGKDAENGYYIQKESYDWVRNGSSTPATPGGTTPTTPGGTTPINMSSYTTSEQLMAKAWEFYNKNDMASAKQFLVETIKRYNATAAQQQAKLKAFAPKGSESANWALNDVGTAHYLLGMIFKKEGNTVQALENFNNVIYTYGYAQAYDPSQKIYWHVADAAKKELA